ncbi:hypothetical protein EP342_01045 [bacterium]|nr:MAG: hypothetical protein EP342_01045 [bacterium]
MKKFLVLTLLALPLALFAKLPSTVNQITVSLVNENGKVIKSGKFNSSGSLTLDGVEDATYSIRLTNGHNSCVLTKPERGDYSGLATGKRQHKPLSFVMGRQEGGKLLCGTTSHLRTKDNNNKLKEEPKNPRKSSSGLPAGKRLNRMDDGTEVIDEWSTSVLVVNDNGNGQIKFQLNSSK